MTPAIQIENLSKMYRLGVIGTGTLSHDLNRWWHKVRGKEDPYLKIGESNTRVQKSNSEYVWALKDISFSVQPGEVLGMIGKNGAGKSTLLKILSKVTGPTTGRIKYNGRIGSLLEVGTGFHPELTGRENIFLNGAILGMTKTEIRRKFDEIIDFAGIVRYVDTPVKRYSSGMKVRLGFAVAAFLEPEILVVDEVLAVGDAEFQKKAIGKMKEVSRSDGRTVLFVSHNMASIANLCPRTILLKDGQIEQDGETNDVIKNYISMDREVYSKAKFTGSSENDLLEKVEVLSDSDVFLTGSPLVFKFTLKESIRESFNILIGIYNSVDEKILHLAIADAVETMERSDTKSITCTVNKNPLLPDNYYANIVLHFKTSGEKYPKCLGFTVLNGDYFKVNRLPRIEKAKVFVDQDWSFS